MKKLWTSSAISTIVLSIQQLGFDCRSYYARSLRLQGITCKQFNFRIKKEQDRFVTKFNKKHRQGKQSELFFKVVCSVTWPLDGIEAGVDLVLIQTSQRFVLLMHLGNIRITQLFYITNRWGLYQNKVHSSLAVMQRPGHWADNCKMVYSK